MVENDRQLMLDCGSKMLLFVEQKMHLKLSCLSLEVLTYGGVVLFSNRSKVRTSNHVAALASGSYYVPDRVD